MEEKWVTPQVVNVRQGKHDCYIGRGSKWGNPFRIGQNGSRDQVIYKYALHLESFPALLQALPELSGKTLGCHCKPQACHGDVLVAAFKYYVEKKEP